MADFPCSTWCMKVRLDTLSWFSREIIEELLVKDELYDLARLTKKLKNSEKFKIQKNRVKNIILEAKEEYVKNYLEENNASSRKFF